MSLADAERVLVVPAEVFRELGYFQGFSGDVERYLDTLLSPAHVSYRPRRQMEQDPSFKQLIPYVIFRHTDDDGVQSVFQYTRGTGQGEQRLHRKRSIGVGGHICADDALNQDVRNPYEEGMWRELQEEVRVNTSFSQRCAGLINDDQTDVGRVHLGVVHLFDVAHPAVEARESEIIATGFRPVEDLADDLEGFETWSQICLEALFRRRAR